MSNRRPSLVSFHHKRCAWRGDEIIYVLVRLGRLRGTDESLGAYRARHAADYIAAKEGGDYDAAGHKAFVNYSGKKVAIIDPLTGEVRMAEIFVAVLGASHLTYAEASWTQTLPDWIAAHIRMFRFWGAAPRLLVPDNLKSGVNKASFYDPEVNRSYGKMATHYNVGILPTRPRKPKDKAAVEAGSPFRPELYSRPPASRHLLFPG